MNIEAKGNPEDVSLDDYYQALRFCDIATCEAKAVGQALAGRYEKPYKGWSSSIFTRLCIHAGLIMRNAPKSRWFKADYELWDYSCIAPHVRAIMEGELLLFYISRPPLNEEEWLVKLKILHLNDCNRRIKLFESIGDAENLEAFLREKEILIEDISKLECFKALPSDVKKKATQGKILTIQSRDELLRMCGIDGNYFNPVFDHLSHYTHILPYSFYRIEANGRGTGIFNDTDKGFIYSGLIAAAESMTRCTDIMIGLFPDTKNKRKGLKSKFSPGPKPR
ncbi:hypothetical protein RFD78_002959 [Klebsiella aerogenes]|nr:hypothetical protein [Klebsiella aerogenes]ELA0228349.1 hypothetical protein [Klebsiella aerogenes]HBR6996449.1 hypothetical protein [Klebsiella aerogenes]HEN4994676.1 hypothetical protein [Klebsiella aerogenes]